MFNFIKNIFKGQSEQNIVDKNQDTSLSICLALQAHTLYKLGDSSKAIIDIQKAIEMDPNNDMYYVTSALINVDLGLYERALFDIDKALEINGKVIQTQELKTEILSKINK